MLAPEFENILGINPKDLLGDIGEKYNDISLFKGIDNKELNALWSVIHIHLKTCLKPKQTKIGKTTFGSFLLSVVKLMEMNKKKPVMELMRGVYFMYITRDVRWKTVQRMVANNKLNYSDFCE